MLAVRLGDTSFVQWHSAGLVQVFLIDVMREDASSGVRCAMTGKAVLKPWVDAESTCMGLHRSRPRSPIAQGRAECTGGLCPHPPDLGETRSSLVYRRLSLSLSLSILFHFFLVSLLLFFLLSLSLCLSVSLSLSVFALSPSTLALSRNDLFGAVSAKGWIPGPAAIRKKERSTKNISPEPQIQSNRGRGCSKVDLLLYA